MNKVVWIIVGILFLPGVIAKIDFRQTFAENPSESLTIYGVNDYLIGVANTGKVIMAFKAFLSEPIDMEGELKNLISIMPEYFQKKGCSVIVFYIENGDHEIFDIKNCGITDNALGEVAKQFRQKKILYGIKLLVSSIKDLRTKTIKLDTIAHQGASAYAPGNSLTSFQVALEKVSDYFELDVHLTKDGFLIVYHDTALEIGNYGYKIPINQISLQELRRLPEGTEERMPTLQQVIDKFKGKIKMVIEIKPRSLIRIDEADDKLRAQKVVKMLEENGIANEAIVASFSMAALEEINNLNPNIETLLFNLPGRFLNWWFNVNRNIRNAKDLGVSSIARKHNTITKGLIREAHKNGLQVYAYTVNDKKSMKKLINLGVDGIITDKPDIVHQVKSEMSLV